MAGAMAAQACAAAGMKVILLEAGRVGQGGSGRATGLISSEACASYRDLEARAGKRAARALFEATARAPRELAARQDEGLAASWLSPAMVQRQTALASAGAMKLPDWGFVDPYKLTLGFLSAAIKKGVKVYERSRINKITFNRKNATAFLDGGAITTENLIICIGEPTSLFKPLKRHLKHEDRYAVLTEPLPAAVRAELGQQAALVTDLDAPPHQLWFTADHRALFTGADQKRPADRLREQTLVQRTGQLMYELTRLYPAISGVAPAHGWDVPLAHPIDDVLYAGAHRNFPHQHFAFGTSHDPARAFLASRLILRAVQGKPDKQDVHFSFARNL